MTFAEYRHRHTNYDNRLRGARSPEQQRAVMESVALAAMQLAVQKQDRAFAASVMSWAQAKHILTLN